MHMPECNSPPNGPEGPILDPAFQAALWVVNRRVKLRAVCGFPYDWCRVKHTDRPVGSLCGGRRKSRAGLQSGIREIATVRSIHLHCTAFFDATLLLSQRVQVNGCSGVLQLSSSVLLFFAMSCSLASWASSSQVRFSAGDEILRHVSCAFKTCSAAFRLASFTMMGNLHGLVDIHKHTVTFRHAHATTEPDIDVLLTIGIYGGFYVAFSDPKPTGMLRQLVHDRAN